MSTLEMILWLAFAVATFGLLAWALFASAECRTTPSQSDRPTPIRIEDPRDEREAGR